MIKNKTIEQLQQENERLKRELSDERIRAELYKKMIEIAERDLGIPVEKKIWSQAILEYRQPKNKIAKERCCRLLGYTRQALHKKQQRAEPNLIEADLVISEVKQIRKKQPRLGSKKVYSLMCLCIHPSIMMVN